MSVFLFLFLFFLLLLPPVIFLLLSFFPCNNREREGALGLQWPGISDVGGNLCSRTTRIWGGWFPAEGDEELAGTASRRASLRLQRRWLWWLLWGERYASDSAVAAADSLAFAARALSSGGGGARPAWVFDVDETLLTNAPYYAVNGWGSLEFNETSFDEWVDVAKAPALPASLKLYNELQGLGIHIILLTGRSEFQRNATQVNLLFAGYHSWEKLILRQSPDIGKTAVQYKSERRAALEAEGFKILGNSGDQWSDLLGLPMATRSFKLPNPMCAAAAVKRLVLPCS
uniref:Acid phosphatase n=1 Tax=Oryza barthii TaxID=65489 RepID=A0A0D3GHV1_9ORYZ